MLYGSLHSTGLASLVSSPLGDPESASCLPDDDLSLSPHRYVCFTVNLHQFPYVAKNALHHLQSECFPRMLTNVGLVVEARDETELPEVSERQARSRSDKLGSNQTNPPLLLTLLVAGDAGVRKVGQDKEGSVLDRGDLLWGGGIQGLKL